MHTCIVHTRCIQLGRRERQDEHEDVQPDDVRWHPMTASSVSEPREVPSHTKRNNRSAGES
jgi:hypothetical protein